MGLTTGFPDMMQFQSWVQDTKIKRLLKHAGLNFDAGESPAGGPAEPEPEKKKEPTPEPEPELSPEEQEKKDKKDKADEIKAKGTEAYKAKKFDEALQLYTEAHEACPEEPVYVLNMAATKLMMGDLDGCEEDCNNAIKISREHFCDF